MWEWITDRWADLNDGSGVEAEQLLQLLGMYGGSQGWFNSDQEKAGYQGKIPDYTAVRDRVPMDWDSDRRPGEYGRQYFSDTIYADTPEDMLKRVNPPPLAEAQATAAAQASQLQQRNTQAFAGGGIVEAMNALRNSPPQAPQMPQRQQQMPQMPQRPQMPQQAQGMPQQRPQGIMGAAPQQFQRGPTDGMGDQVPARINGQQPAEMSDGEFVLPADVVGHLGNGNSEAGAQQLYAMMDRIRQARTGSKQQGNQINPNSFLPKA